MARTWGLAPEQTAEFEIVVTDFHQERQAVFDQITDEQITPEELGEGLREVDERATARLREVLGPERLLEYQLTAGHFVEAGLDQKPFVPPTPVAVADARPAGVEPPSAAVDTR